MCILLDNLLFPLMFTFISANFHAIILQFLCKMLFSIVCTNLNLIQDHTSTNR
jgi:hypothetical protein